MSEPDSFLTRWSQRKWAAAKGAVPEQNEARLSVQDENSSTKEQRTATPSPAGSDPVPENQPVDLGSLPPIELISADTDITAFLRPGVPAELTRAALRRAWSTDPAIRDFVGLVENGWDFNDPQAMAGFGRIEPGDVARLLSQKIGEVSAEPTRPPVDALKATGLASQEGVPSEQNQHEVQDPHDGVGTEQKDVRCSGTDCALRESS